MRKTRGSKAHAINGSAGHKKWRPVEFGHCSSQPSQNRKNGTSSTPVHTTNHGPNTRHSRRQVVTTTQSKLLLLGGWVLALGLPRVGVSSIEGGTVLCGGLLGGGGLLVTMAMVPGHLSLRWGELGPVRPPPSPAPPCRQCLIRAYPSPHHRHQGSGHQRENNP